MYINIYIHIGLTFPSFAGSMTYTSAQHGTDWDAAANKTYTTFGGTAAPRLRSYACIRASSCLALRRGLSVTLRVSLVSLVCGGR